MPDKKPSCSFGTIVALKAMLHTRFIFIFCVCLFLVIYFRQSVFPFLICLNMHTPLFLNIVSLCDPCYTYFYMKIPFEICVRLNQIRVFSLRPRLLSKVMFLSRTFAQKMLCTQVQFTLHSQRIHQVFFYCYHLTWIYIPLCADYVSFGGFFFAHRILALKNGFQSKSAHSGATGGNNNLCVLGSPKVKHDRQPESPKNKQPASPNILLRPRSMFSIHRFVCQRFLSYTQV